MRVHPSLAATLIAVAACGGGGGTEPPVTVASLSVSPPQPDSLFARGATIQLQVVARDANNATISNPSLTFGTGNSAVATVSTTGLVTAQGNGETNVTVSSGSASASVAIRVRRKVASVEVTPSSRTLPLGGTQTFTATAMDANDNPVTGIAATFTSNDAAVEITAAGAATAKAIGSAVITATMQTVDGERQGTATVNVQNLPQTATITLTAAAFSPTSVDIASGGTVTFSNTSGVLHNVMFESSAITDIQDHLSGQNLRTFTQPGTYGFLCTNHPGMVGSVVVQ